MIGGALTQAPVPPAGFRPEAATPEALTRYGFPARPENAEDVAAWESDMRTYKSTPLPELCDSAEITGDLMQPGPDDGITPRPIPGVVNRTSANWAGWEARAASGNRFVAVSGEYNIAARQADTCTNSRLSNWVGIGGADLRDDGSAGLLQTGTAFATSGGPYAWWEYIGVDDHGNDIGVVEQRITSLDVVAGDHIHTSVFYQTSNDQANFIVQDETTGQSQSIKRTIGARFYQGGQAEFVTERPTVNDSLSPLLAGVSWLLLG